ncbi:uncharacterized protein BP5553_08401 [Venustampulla echinocandica]|uniref:Heterokaryon incompatibility domain-containing protein n=1 Tax=Venustampulla echinocandica TaxID=2656787 RepID=A0A370TE36_9HELO|nr:uncharacterized protein BP5553_08401 [Venustampulla echinocandica]RDL32962.1 hypothetical protein BP5553_08401 [Venustampulla echinocandica]
MPDGSTFRIVSVFPGKGDAQIECDFLEVPNSSKPKYSALSYTWGDPTVNSFVWMHGNVIGTAENLQDALKHLRDPLDVRTFWIDALCINQKDEAEKATQIPLMRRIYQRSNLVVIYLGTYSDGSDTIPAFCERIEKAHKQIEELYADDLGNPRFIQKIIAGSDYQTLGLPESNSEYWHVFQQFLSRPWFKRVWVIQEAVLSNSAEIVCGDWSMNWNDFIAFLLKSYIAALPIFPSEVETKRFSNRPTDSSVTMSLIIFMMALGAAKGEFCPWNYVDLLHRGRIAFATKAHDYCYGLLGLSKELMDPNIKIDYSISVEEVYRQFARYFVIQGNGVKVLYNAAGHDLDLPSWVPDWSCRNIGNPRLCPEPRVEPLEDIFCSAASSIPSNIRLHPTSPDVLIVGGIIFDRIEPLGSQHISNFEIGYDREQKLTARYDGKAKDRDSLEGHEIESEKGRITLITVLENSIIADCVTELCELLDAEQLRGYPTSENYVTVIWRTLTCNMSRGSQQKAPASYSEFFKAFLISTTILDPTWQLPQILQQNQQEPEDSERNFRDCIEILMQSTEFVRCAKEHCYSRKRGRTVRGYAGQFSLYARVGDAIFLPLGSAVPFLIRPKNSTGNMYEIIEECYVHGIMEGEAFKLENVAKIDIHLA